MALSRRPNLTLLQVSSRLSSNASSSRKSSRLLTQWLSSFLLVPPSFLSLWFACWLLFFFSFLSLSLSLSLFPYLSGSPSSLLPQALTGQTKLSQTNPPGPLFSGFQHLPGSLGCQPPSKGLGRTHLLLPDLSASPSASPVPVSPHRIPHQGFDRAHGLSRGHAA